MVKITKITTQKKNKHRFNIYVDDGEGETYGFSVDEDILIEYHMRKGLELTKEKMDKLAKQDDFHKLYNQVIHYLSYRNRTEKEVRDYLRKKDALEQQIEQIINQLTDKNLLDDREFAHLFVRSRLNMSSKGPGLIEKELIAKGVAPQIANEAVEQFAYEDQVDKALQLVKKRLNRSNNDSFRKQLDQAQAALMRNGYQSDVIRSVIDQVKDGRNEDEEWRAIEYHGDRLHRRFADKLSETEQRQKIKEGLYRQGFALGLIQQYLETR